MNSAAADIARGAPPGGDPKLVVLSILFPNPAEPGAGVFIKERMFRVAKHLPLVVVSPQPWFPLQGLIRLRRPHFRPSAPRYEKVAGIEIFRPRFLSVPGLLKRWDGLFMALGCYTRLRRLQGQGRVDVIDAHFAYPDGYAAACLGDWLGVPVTITLRGTEQRIARDRVLRRRLLVALRGATRVFAVAASLRQLVIGLGAAADKIQVVPNGVDVQKFSPVSRADARRELGVDDDAPVLVTVGTLVERKGFHRVIDIMPKLLERYPRLQYLVVGGSGPEGDWEERLRKQVRSLGLQGHVRFTGPVAPEALRVPLSAADVFVLATRNEGWANVFLEAMTCGLPVVTTDVGGNSEVVCRPELGTVVPFGDPDALFQAVDVALQHPWDRAAIMRYAADNAWDGRVATLLAAFREVAAAAPASHG